MSNTEVITNTHNIIQSHIDELIVLGKSAYLVQEIRDYVKGLTQKALQLAQENEILRASVKKEEQADG